MSCDKDEEDIEEIIPDITKIGSVGHKGDKEVVYYRTHETNFLKSVAKRDRLVLYIKDKHIAPPKFSQTEWHDIGKTFNIIAGGKDSCPNRCKYCYIIPMDLRFKRITEDEIQKLKLMMKEMFFVLNFCISSYYHD